jgi:hypothetical protein
MKSESDDDALLRAALTRAGGKTKGRGAGYPPELRARVAAYAMRCGLGMNRVAEQLGIARGTLQKWVRESSSFVPFVVGDAAPTRVVLVSPTGWRIELDPDTLRALVLGAP